MNERLLRASTWLKALAGLAGVGVLTAVYQGVVGGLSYDVLRDHADWLISPVPLPAWVDLLVLGLLTVAAYLVGRFLHGPVVVAGPGASPVDTEAASKEDIRAAFRELGAAPTTQASALLSRLATPLQELGWDDELGWCRKELVGYDDIEEVPAYRNVTIVERWKPLEPVFVDIYSGQTGLPPGTTRHGVVRNSVSELVKLAKSGSSQVVGYAPPQSLYAATKVDEILPAEYQKALRQALFEASDRILTRANA